MAIDRADWHYGGDYPENLPPENGGTHIGMYLAWIINNDLIGQLHLDEEDSFKAIQEVKSRRMTGREFLFKYCDEKFWNEDLNEEGIAFTNFYYLSSEDESIDYAWDYERLLGGDLNNIYEIENSWANYDTIATRITTVYNSWKERRD